MNGDLREYPATEEQKEKLRFFGCTWDDGITASQASDALEECARQFPDVETSWQKKQPATEKQKEKLRFFGCTWSGAINVGQASDALLQCASEFPDEEAIWQSEKTKWSKVAGSFPATLQRETPVTIAPAKILQTRQSFHELPRRVTTILSPMFPGENSVSSKQHDEAFLGDVPLSKAESVESEMPDGSDETPQQYLERTGCDRDPNWRHRELDKTKQTANSVSKQILTYDAARQMGEAEWHDWIGLHGSYGTEPGHKLTYGDARKMSEMEWNNWIVAHGRQVARQVGSVGDQPVAPVYIPPTPEQFAEIRSMGKEPPKGLTFQEATTWIEQLKIFFTPKTGQFPPEPPTVENDWPTAPASEKQKEKLRLLGCTFFDGITVEIAKILIELHEAESGTSHPSVRREGFFCGDDQTGAVGDQAAKEWGEWLALQERLKERLIKSEVTIQPATKPRSPNEYTIPANELQHFDHEQAETVADIFPQFLESHVAALKKTNNYARKVAAEALGRSKDSHAVKPLINCLADPYWDIRILAARSLGRFGGRDAVNPLITALKDREPSVRKEVATALGKIQDIRAVGALTASLHDDVEYVRKAAAEALRLILRNQFFPVVPKPVQPHRHPAVLSNQQTTKPAPKPLVLDMEKVRSIKSETKEVIGILSIIMEDETKTSVSMSEPKFSNRSDFNNSPIQSKQFKGLDVAFNPILERLLTREAWPLADFNALAREFHFMPGKIFEILNEWSDEALGDFILEGEDPVVIRGELMTKNDNSL